MPASRSSLAITLSVWKALFLRESLSRLFSARAAWFWLIAEPVIGVAIIQFVFTAVRVRHVGGIETPVWLMTGMLGFFMFRRTANQVMNGINANQSLFAYRQVKPIDTLLVRAALEAVLLFIISVVLFIGTGLFGYSVIPNDPFAVLLAFTGLWIVGLGFGLITSVANELIPEFGRILGFLMRPMMIISGVIFPLSSIPAPYRTWIMLNPIAHGLEAIRLGFAPYYHAVPELNMAYIYEVGFCLLFLGLALQRRFALRLIAQ